MRFHFSIVVILAVALAACAPQVPNSARGVGFDTVQAGQARDAALQGAPIVSTTVIGPPLSGTTLPPGSPEDTAAQTTRVLEQTRTVGTDAAGVQTQATTPVTNTGGISNENNFDAVAEQRSIEGDAARLEQNRAQYQIVEPRALPERAGNEQPNIVAFALSTDHAVGARVYARAGLNGAGRAERNCAQYASPDQAQIDFLERGGPLRDRRGLDPDGDGFACAWDPSPFRKAGQG